MKKSPRKCPQIVEFSILSFMFHLLLNIWNWGGWGDCLSSCTALEYINNDEGRYTKKSIFETGAPIVMMHHHWSAGSTHFVKFSLIPRHIALSDTQLFKKMNNFVEWIKQHYFEWMIFWIWLKPPGKKWIFFWMNIVPQKIEWIVEWMKKMRYP